MTSSFTLTDQRDSVTRRVEYKVPDQAVGVNFIVFYPDTSVCTYGIQNRLELSSVHSGNLRAQATNQSRLGDSHKRPATARHVTTKETRFHKQLDKV